MRLIHLIRHGRRCPIALACAGVLLTPACTFRATPNPDALPSEPPQVKKDEGSAGAPAMAVMSGRLAADSGKPQPPQAAAVDAGAAAAPSSTVSAQQPMAAAAPASHMNASTVMPHDADPDDAGSPHTPRQADAGAVSAAKVQQCDAELSSCLIADPLGYDVCLRKNAEHGCPAPETMGTMTTTPVLDENGKPISQVCQAELAKCIMRMPTPENASECTQAARKCK